MNPKTIACLLVALLVLAGCGNKGALYLDPVPHPKVVQGLSVRQIGSSVRLQWALAERLDDDQTAMDLKRLGQTTLRMSDKRLPPGRYGGKSSVLAKFKPESLSVDAARMVTATCPIKLKTPENRQLFFTVEYEWARRHSSLGEPAVLNALTPPSPIRDLSVTREGKVIVLHWTPPPAVPLSPTPPATGATGPQPPGAAGKPAAGSTGAPAEIVPLGYDIYRRIVGSADQQELRRINDRPIGAAYYEDRAASLDGEYHYQVTLRLSDAVESDYSNDVSIAFADTFAPDTPRGLVAFSGRDHILLSWEKVADLDLVGYRVYRKGPQEGVFRQVAELVTENVFRDTQVEKGKTYQYTVSAVDGKKNESTPSTAVAQKFD